VFCDPLSSPSGTLFELFARERFSQTLIRSDFANSESRSVGQKPNETGYEPGAIDLTLSQDGLLIALSLFPPPKLFDKLVNSRARV
jgi:hypothetical protein